MSIKRNFLVMVNNLFRNVVVSCSKNVHGMHKFQSNSWQDVCVGETKKRGVRVICGWKHFFVLIFLRPPLRLLFLSRKKVMLLEAITY